MCFTPWSPIGQALAVVGESIYDLLDSTAAALAQILDLILTIRRARHPERGSLHRVNRLQKRGEGLTRTQALAAADANVSFVLVSAGSEDNGNSFVPVPGSIAIGVGGKELHVRRSEVDAAVINAGLNQRNVTRAQLGLRIRVALIVRSNG